MAGARDGRRRLAGRAARDDAGPRALLGERVRLAPLRSQAQQPAELPHRDRRAGHPLHPRALKARGRASSRRHARLARLDRRAAEDHRATDRSHVARRERGRRVPSRDPVAAGPRVLRQADRHGLGSGADRARLERADAPPGLRRVRRAGRRLGRRGDAADGHPGAGRPARHPLQHAGHRAARDRQRIRVRRRAAGRPVGRGAARVRAARRLLWQARGLRADHVDASADALRVRRLADRLGGLRARPRRRHRPARPREGRARRHATRAPSRATTCSTTSRSTG